MPRALLDPSRCRPDRCPRGECLARSVCSVRAIYQAEPFDPPLVDWSRCHACAKCIAACPEKAVSLVS